MAGTLIRVLPRTDFVATNVSTAAVETVLVKQTDVIAFNSLVLIVRIHAKSTAGAAQTLNVLVKNIAPTLEDVVADFVGATIATATFTMHSGTSGPQTPQIIQFANPVSSSVRLLMSCTQTTSTNTFTFSMSADYGGRE